MKASLIIRFTNTVSNGPEIRDLEIPLSINFDKDDINKLVNTTWLKVIIRNKVPVSERRRLRLIYNGRVLNQTTNFRKDVFEPKLRQMEANSEEEGDEEMKVYIHCVIGDELTYSQLNEENQLDNRPQQVSTTPDIIGFDRLLQQGFSQDDINDLRRQFHSIYMPNLFESRNGGVDSINDVEEEERRQRLISELEERWIESTINNNPTNETSNRPPTTAGPASGNEQTQAATAPAAPSNDVSDINSNEDLLLGLGLGIFLGAISVIFILLDDTVFNKRQKMAVFAGVFINVSFAIVRGQWI